MPRTGRPPIYPWAMWLDGERRLLLPPKDFNRSVSVQSFRAQVYAEARRRGLKVSCRHYGEGLEVQAGAATPRPGGRPPSQDWDRILSGEPVTLSSDRDFRGGVKRARAIQNAAHRAARRRGLKIRTMVTGDGRSAQIMIVSNAKEVERERRQEELLEAFPPPILVDEGIDEDSEFEYRDWNGKVYTPSPPPEEPRAYPDGMAELPQEAVDDFKRNHGSSAFEPPATYDVDAEIKAALSRATSWDEPTAEEIAEAERLAAEH